MKIRLLKDYLARKKGDILEIGGGVADIWIRSGRAEEVKPEDETDKMLRPKKRTKARNRRVATK